MYFVSVPMIVMSITLKALVTHPAVIVGCGLSVSDEIVRRDANGRFLNQGGPTGSRPKGYKGIAKYIMSKSNNGEDLIDYLFKVLSGEVEGGSTLAAKMWATEQLLNRGLGKAPQMIEINTTIDTEARATMIDMGAMSDEELEAMEKAAEIASRYAGNRKPIDV